MKKKNQGPYKDHEIAELVKLRGEGVTEKEIAKRLGRPYNSVHCKIKELRKAGELPLVRDTTPVSDEDVEELAIKHGVAVALVQTVIEQVGSRMRTRLAEVDAALLAWNVQARTCAYFGVPISLEASVTLPTRAVLSKDKQGRPLWVSKMAAKMRGKLSHEMFLKSIVTIYEHVFTKTR